MTRIDKNIYLDLYFMMKKIRMTEEKIAENYHEDNMHTPVHLYIGQEAIAAGVCSNLKPTDKVFSNHRNHGHYLAKGGDLYAMIAELHNKETGCSRGRGGSMHLTDNSVGFPITSAIVAGGVPIATGSALASTIRKSNDVSVVFFGDAASEEGVVFESMCFAALKKLPIIYICENNMFSVCTPLEKREVSKSVCKKFESVLNVKYVDGNDVESIYLSAKEAIDNARVGGGPLVIECLTYRMRDHHDTRTGVDAGYQTQDEWQFWSRRCPIEKARKNLYEEGVLDEYKEKEFEKMFMLVLDDAFRKAIADPLPKPDDIYYGLFG